MSTLEPLHVQHNGSESLAINNTRFRRFVTLLALKTTARFYSHMGVCVPISRHKIVKYGPFTHLTEAATMKFIAENTSIPVPKVYCSFFRKDRAYIVMERLRGESIGSALGKLSQESRQSIFAQLRLMIQELRALQQPPGVGVESCVGGSLYDCRIPRHAVRFGPFKTIQEFHVWLRCNCQPTSRDGCTLSDEEWKDFQDMVSLQDGPWPSPVFTHGDLNCTNIFVRGDKVVGIIDWESAGWYPHYWEYTSAWGHIYSTEWQDLIPNFLDQHPAELRMEVTRQRWWGEV